MNIKRFLWIPAAIATGLLLSASFAPFNKALCGFVAVLILSWTMYRSARPVRWAYLFALAYFGSGLHWVYISLYRFGEAHLFFALSANVLLIALLALFPATVAYFLRLFSAPRSAFRLFLFPFLWMLSEYGRAYFLSGFPWLSIGYGQIESAFAGFAPVGGVWLVGLMMLLGSALLIALYEQKALRRIYLIVLIIFFGATVLLQKMDWVEAHGEPIQMALVQGNVPQLEKFQRDKMQQQLDLYLHLSEQHPDAEVMVWPETAITFWIYGASDPLLNTLAQFFERRGQILVTGLVEIAAKDVYYNAVWALGAERGFYHKRHLLPFGEYLPLRPLFARFHDYVAIPLSDFTVGSSNEALPAAGKAGVSICFEAAFGRELQQTLPAAEYLINVSNDGWFDGSVAYDQHLQMNQMRALELGREMARATNTGLTAFLDVKGRIKALLPRNEQGVLRGEIQKYQGLTPYARWGNHLFEVLMLLYLGLLGSAFWWRKASSKTEKTV